MRRLFVILACLLVASSFGQSNRRRMLLSDRNKGGGAFTPQSIQGMAFFWNYNSIAQGVVSSWPDDIQGYPYGQTVASLQPTNTATGVYFQGNNAQRIGLTNATGISVNSNFTFWCAFKMDGSALGTYLTLFTSNNQTGFWAENKPPRDGDYFHPSADHHFGGFLTTNAFYDIVWAFGPTYTNGTATTSNCLPRTIDQNFTKIGFDGTAADQFGGYIKFIGIWTNKAITATDAANLYTWSIAH